MKNAEPTVETAVDLLDLDRWAAEGPPYDWFAHRRAEAPVWIHPGRGGTKGFWVVSGHAEVTALGRCPHTMSSDDDHGGVTGLGEGDELQEAFDLMDGQVAPLRDSADTKMLLSLDPPEHSANRKILNRAFTPGSVQALEPAVRDLTSGLLDGHTDGTTFDFTTDVAMPLPMQVIGDLLGAPRDTHGDLLRWSNAAVAGTDPEYLCEGQSSMDAVLHLSQLFIGLRMEREAERRDDLVSRLLDGTVDGEPLPGTRYLMYLILLVTAGNETTRNAMSHGVGAFADHPDQWQRLREDRGLIDSAVEEVLRWSSPILYFRRNAIEEMTVAGATIEPGDLVSLWYVSANHDETVFDHPDRFDIGRRSNPHVAFGGGGPHFCLGASLARLEIRVLLEEMLDRFETVERDGPPVRLRSNFLNGIKHMPIRLRT